MGKRRNATVGAMMAADDYIAEDTVNTHVNVHSTHYELLANGRLSTRSTVLNVSGSDHSPDVPQEDAASSSNAMYSAPLEVTYIHGDDVPAEPGYAQHLEDTSAIRGLQKKRRTDHPLRNWLEEREQFLSESLRLEGKGDNGSECSHCQQLEPSAVYRCLDCDGVDMVCEECLLTIHRRNGLHRIQRWDAVNGFFKEVFLRSLGHYFQLGHPIGKQCPLPESSFASTFTVLDINGIHEVRLYFCNCEQKQLHFIQLLRFGWFPATVGFPRTAVTFRLLKHFQILLFESKSTVFEVYQTLVRLTDNTGTTLVKDRYRTLLRVVREYRHIKMLKQAGRGHDREGAEGTKCGQCAVLCPACPQPGINLPPDWQDAPPERRFLYTLFVGLDANFRLKRRMISNHASDPSLAKGWAYFVDKDDYKAFLHAFGKIIVQEPSNCSNHDAVNKQRGKEGFAASGVGTCDCTRHDMKRPNSVGDLQLGEAYVNMDFLFFCSLIGNELVEVVVSYDIACQWSIHLWERMQIYPVWMHIDHEERTSFRFLIPKFHLPAHIRACQTTYSFNYNKYSGRTDGEGVERGWGHINPVATSTREMGPGSRRDTLDDHFGDWNWTKTCGMGALLLRRVREAVLELDEKTILHDQFSKGLPAPDVAEWTQQLTAWEVDHSKPNPFEATFKALSQESVRRQLADEEAKDLTSGSSYVMHEDVTASQLIIMGLDLENQQRRLETDYKALGLHATDDQRAKWTVRSNTLRRKINSWIEVQQLYIPSLRLVRSRAAEATQEQEERQVYDIPLLLPSSISSTLCDGRLRDIEWRLRYAQCTDSLDDLRDGLCMKAYVLIDKSRFQRGQVANTRSQGIVNRIQAKIETSAERYRAARDAISKLASMLGQLGWQEHLLKLKDEDIRPLLVEDAEEKKKKKKKKGRGQGDTGTDAAHVSEGRRTVSWIWTRLGGEVDLGEDQRLHESLRIAWCKSKARMDRWQEEVALLQEEKRRIVAFLGYRATVWDERAEDDGDWMLPKVSWDPVAIDGRIVYAQQQAAQFREMQSHCTRLWCSVDEFIRQGGKNVKLVPDGVTIDDDADADDDNDIVRPPQGDTNDNDEESASRRP
ncbi:hypothetical protein B0H34DRAFT_734685 [Crassisporium funariophilum]|nr:hypothetical protein B0H34DRAFT_734685 [Crassisporium funariophilum]